MQTYSVMARARVLPSLIRCTWKPVHSDVPSGARGIVRHRHPLHRREHVVDLGAKRRQRRRQATHCSSGTPSAAECDQATRSNHAR